VSCPCRYRPNTAPKRGLLTVASPCHQPFVEWKGSVRPELAAEPSGEVAEGKMWVARSKSACIISIAMHTRGQICWLEVGSRVLRALIGRWRRSRLLSEPPQHVENGGLGACGQGNCHIRRSLLRGERWAFSNVFQAGLDMSLDARVTRPVVHDAGAVVVDSKHSQSAGEITFGHQSSRANGRRGILLSLGGKVRRKASVGHGPRCGERPRQRTPRTTAMPTPQPHTVEGLVKLRLFLCIRPST